MRRSVLPLTLVGVATLGAGMVACAREVEFRSGPSWVGDVGPDAASGVVRRIGNEPFVRTILQGESAETAVTVGGSYEVEIARLAGAQVSATGRFARSDERGRYLDVSSYEILAVDEERPFIGTLGQDDEGFVLTMPGGAAIRLAAVPEELEAALGGRVWVTLDESRTVTRHGVLRTPGEMAELESQGPADQS